MGLEDVIWNKIIAFITSNPLIANSSIGIMILSNIYFIKKSNDRNKELKNYIGLFKDIEPLLTKIIDEKKFTKSEIQEAIRIKNKIKSDIIKNVN